jgi:hypothetical protein
VNLSKKQVKAFLEVISSDETRPVLTHAKIDELEGQPVLIGTDSYKLAAIKLTDDILPKMGSLIPRAELVKWYKLASNKDYLTETELLEMAIPDDQGFGEDKTQYPKWQKLVPSEDTRTELTGICINADFMATMQILSGSDGYSGGMPWEFYGSLSPVISRKDGSIYLVMPLKK